MAPEEADEIRHQLQKLKEELAFKIVSNEKERSEYDS